MAGALNRKFFFALEANLYNFPIIYRRDIFHVCGEFLMAIDSGDLFFGDHFATPALFVVPGHGGADRCRWCFGPSGT
jgi:hypothetical protein